jgi:hypothetical protein
MSRNCIKPKNRITKKVTNVRTKAEPCDFTNALVCERMIDEQTDTMLNIFSDQNQPFPGPPPRHFYCI